MHENIVCIPFRDRAAHLDYFLANTVPLLEDHLPGTQVVVVEQEEGKPFNRGMLLNTAFKEYKGKTKYFFAHDVDMNPSLSCVKSTYTIEGAPLVRINSPHAESLGGVIKIGHDPLYAANGFPNYIWGWGIEDRVLFHRCRLRHVHPLEGKDRTFTVMPHTSNVRTYTGNLRNISDAWTYDRLDSMTRKQQENMIMGSGINNIKYTILDRRSIGDIVELMKVSI